jgi:GH25 family lysozyme M1 (1,4-beta-N-acetylmuramidase)
MFFLPMAVAATILVYGTPSIQSQEANQDETNPVALRRYWMSDAIKKGQDRTSPGLQSFLLTTPPPYILTPQERDKFKGTFGVDLSHYSFDLSSNSPPKCKTQAGFDDPDCSCSINWQTVIDNGLQFVYLKATDGSGIDLSFATKWKDLEAPHQSKTLFRGAYHFLRPGIDARTQADVFLKAVGAVDGNKPAQMPPVLDIEWASKSITPGTPEFDACPANRRLVIDADKGKYQCDTWYRTSSKDIAALAAKWIELVETATGRPVIIYTNAGAWWDPNMDANGKDLIKKQAVWLSRYLAYGPNYSQGWTVYGGSPKWKMPPLPKPGSYSPDTYSVANFWQFTESGGVKPNLYTCSGQSKFATMDLNWMPVSGTEFQTLFGVAGQ